MICVVEVKFKDKRGNKRYVIETKSHDSARAIVESYVFNKKNIATIDITNTLRYDVPFMVSDTVE